MKLYCNTTLDGTKSLIKAPGNNNIAEVPTLFFEDILPVEIVFLGEGGGVAPFVGQAGNEIKIAIGNLSNSEILTQATLAADGKAILDLGTNSMAFEMYDFEQKTFTFEIQISYASGQTETLCQVPCTVQNQLIGTELIAPAAPSEINAKIATVPTAPSEPILNSSPTAPNGVDLKKTPAAPSEPILNSSPAAPSGIDLKKTPEAPSTIDLKRTPAAPSEPILNSSPAAPGGIDLKKTPAAPGGIDLERTPAAPSGLDLDSSPTAPGGIDLKRTPAAPSTIDLESLTQWNPSETTTELWLDSDDTSTITKDSNLVSSWADKSGNGNHATQAISTSKPTFTLSNSLLNNKSSVSSSSASGSIGLNLPSITLQEIFVVTYYKDGSDSTFDGYNTLISGPGSAGTYRIMGSKGTVNWITSSNFNEGGNFKNGATSSSNSALPMPVTLLRFTSSVPRTETRGILYNTVQASRGWIGGVGEIIGLSATSSTSDRQKIEGYLAHKWGIEADLPNGHQYKNSAP